MKVRYTPQALSELSEILIEIATKSPQGARQVQARIKTILDLLTAYLEGGQLVSVREMRRDVVTPYPYLVFYRLTREEIVIVGVRHGHRRPVSFPV